MRFVAVLLGAWATTELSACARAEPARWVDANGVQACECDGTLRDPTPSEAASFPPGKSIESFCEGKTHDCGPYRGRGPFRWDD